MKWSKETLQDIMKAYDLESIAELSGKALLRMTRVVSYKLPVREEWVIENMQRTLIET
ncbi:MAG: hypothetical protein ACFFBD_16205 [Candidatus Hodarchaeota archaeon]